MCERLEKQDCLRNSGARPGSVQSLRSRDCLRNSGAEPGNAQSLRSRTACVIVGQSREARKA